MNETNQNHLTRIHAFSDDCLAEHDAVALVRLIQTQELSRKEVIEAAIARIEKLDSHLNGLAIDNFQKALDSAETVNGGFFDGVPTLIKDNLPLAGLPTGYGSEAIVDPIVADENDAYVKQFMELGFNALGKTRLSEFGLNATTEPPDGKPVRNPWHTEYSSGASSSGSAALVAGGAVPIAHGNDGGGSIRIPAACCGLVGLKPSRGRHIVSELVKSLPVAVVSDGVLTRTVRDTAVFHAEMEKVYKNPKLPEIGFVESPPKKRLRIGLQLDSIGGYQAQLEVKEVITKTAALMEEMGHAIEEVQTPFEARFTDDFILYWSFLAFMIPVIGKSKVAKTLDASKLEPFTMSLSRNLKRNFHKLPGSLYRLRGTYHTYKKIFDSCDVLLTPVLAQPPAPLGYIRPDVPFDELIERLKSYACFTPLANVSGAPAISLPVGISAAGLPIGAHFFGNHGDEKTLLELACEIEEAQPWPAIPEKIPANVAA